MSRWSDSPRKRNWELGTAFCCRTFEGNDLISAGWWFYPLWTETSNLFGVKVLVNGKSGTQVDHFVSRDIIFIGQLAED